MHLDQNIKGLTLRAYFIAHAPIKPQGWFEPDMETPRPVDIWQSEDGETTYPSQYDAERAEGFDGFKNASAEKQDAWDSDYRRELYIQWPAAWADAMIAVMERTA